MVNVMYVLFFNSIIISVIAMAYMCIGKVILKKYFAGFYYYSWLVFLVGSLIPFRFNSGMFIKNNTENGDGLKLMQESAAGVGNDVLTKTQAADSGSIINSDIVLGAALIVWFAGFSIFFITAFRKHYKMAGTIKRWETAEKDGRVLALYKRVLHDLKINKAPILMRCKCIDTPMMTGFIRPQIVLPDKKFSDDDRKVYGMLILNTAIYSRTNLSLLMTGFVPTKKNQRK